jgi:pentatricopeptide repeat protein
MLELSNIFVYLQVWEDMKETDITANVITYNALVSACEKGDQWEEALKVWLAKINK